MEMCCRKINHLCTTLAYIHYLTASLSQPLDERLAHEYRSVLARPKFRSVDRAKSDALVNGLLEAGERRTVPVDARRRLGR